MGAAKAVLAARRTARAVLRAIESEGLYEQAWVRTRHRICRKIAACRARYGVSKINYIYDGLEFYYLSR